MYITNKIANQVSDEVFNFGEDLRANYRFYQDNIDMNLLKSMKQDFMDMPIEHEHTPWVPASIAEYIVYAFLHEDEDAEELVASCVNESIDNDDTERFTRLEYLYMFLRIFPKLDIAAANSLFTKYFREE